MHNLYVYHIFHQEFSYAHTPLEILTRNTHCKRMLRTPGIVITGSTVVINSLMSEEICLY